MTVANAIAIFAGFEYFSRVFGFISLPPLDDYILVVYFSVVAYAIVRHNLMDIEVIIKRTVVFAGLASFVFGVFAVVTFVLQQLLSRYIPFGRIPVTFVSVLVIVLGYEPIRNFLINVTDRYLFQKNEDFKVILNRLSLQVITILDMEALGRTILGTLESSLRLESGAIVVRDENEDQYRVLDSFGSIIRIVTFGKDAPLIEYFQNRAQSLNLETAQEKESVPQRLMKLLEQFRAHVCLPLFMSNDLIGILLLGKKKSDQEYSPDELSYFPTVASQVAIALSNARHIEILKKSQVEYAQQAKMAAIGTLSSGISHEIKNPLNNIRGLVGVYVMNHEQGVHATLPKEEQIQLAVQTMKMVEEETNRATEVVQRLSAFAKKPKELIREPVDLLKAVEEALKWMAPEFDRYRIKVVKEFAPNLPMILASSHAMEEIFLNLLINARHAIKKEGTLTIKALCREAETEVAIQDTGCGIPAGHLDKIFDPFFTTKDTSRNADSEAVTGTGLGLYLVRELIKHYGGRIAVESKEGAGTTFHIYFPISDVESNINKRSAA